MLNGTRSEVNCYTFEDTEIFAGWSMSRSRGPGWELCRSRASSGWEMLIPTNNGNENIEIRNGVLGQDLDLDHGKVVRKRAGKQGRQFLCGFV